MSKSENSLGREVLQQVVDDGALVVDGKGTLRVGGVDVYPGEDGALVHVLTGSLDATAEELGRRTVRKALKLGTAEGRASAVERTMGDIRSVPLTGR